MILQEFVLHYFSKMRDVGREAWDVGHELYMTTGVINTFAEAAADGRLCIRILHLSHTECLTVRGQTGNRIDETYK